MHVHSLARGEILKHAFHKVAEASVAQRFIVENDQKWSDQITHALHVAHLKMLPDIAAYRISDNFNNKKSYWIRKAGDNLRANDVS